MSLMNGKQPTKPEDFLPRTIRLLSELGDYELTLPEWLADWDVFDSWEKERFRSMRDNLKNGDILFDIGSERGWQSAMYAKYCVGPENMVLIEPTATMWPVIKAVWDMNFEVKPLVSYVGLLGNKTKNNPQPVFGWPTEIKGEQISTMSYEYIHEHIDRPQITVDDFVEHSGIVPTALTMDTEGAELLILQGAEKTLIHHKPIIWLSEHIELQHKHYGLESGVIPAFMEKMEYKGVDLGFDHEQHWLYRPL